MAEGFRKGPGRLNTIIILTYVVVLVSLLIAQTWPNVVEVMNPGHSSAARGLITSTPSPSPTVVPTEVHAGG